MSTAMRNGIRREVLKYVNGHGPVKIGTMAEALREQHAGLTEVRDSDVRSIVQPMIVTGKLSYAAGLKIQLGKAKD